MEGFVGDGAKNLIQFYSNVIGFFGRLVTRQGFSFVLLLRYLNVLAPHEVIQNVKSLMRRRKVYSNNSYYCFITLLHTLSKELYLEIYQKIIVVIILLCQYIAILLAHQLTIPSFCHFINPLIHLKRYKCQSTILRNDTVTK